jgi:hypothetical protein
MATSFKFLHGRRCNICCRWLGAIASLIAVDRKAVSKEGAIDEWAGVHVVQEMPRSE